MNSFADMEHYDELGSYWCPGQEGEKSFAGLRVCSQECESLIISKLNDLGWVGF